MGSGGDGESVELNRMGEVTLPSRECNKKLCWVPSRDMLGAKRARSGWLRRLRQSGGLSGGSDKWGSEVQSEPGDNGEGLLLRVVRTLYKDRSPKLAVHQRSS